MKKELQIVVILFFATLFGLKTSAQNDSLILNNGNTIVGEIKNMDRGVVTIETPYSKNDFQIEWDGIKEAFTQSLFVFTLANGTRITGKIKTKEGKLYIVQEDGKEINVTKDDIVHVKSFDQSFLDRLYANIDLGYSITKANNQTQFTLGSRLGYIAEMWSLDLYYNSLLSKQDNAADIIRNDAGIGYRYLLPKDWYLSADLTFLNNTEQALRLRTSAKIGAGNYIIHTNRAYWGVGAGINSNSESFFENEGVTAPDRQSFEGYFGTEVNLYDIGDLNLFTSVIAYPSFTESGRWRSDFRFDAKYDNFLLENFYIRAGFTANYDNQPAVAGRELDYVFTTGFGWEL